MTLRLAIVNDYEVVVRGLAEMLSAYPDEVDVVELNAQVPVHTVVDIALYDTFAQTPGDGQDVATLSTNPQVGRVVVYTWDMDPDLVERSLARGAAGYLSKSLGGAELVEALRAVHSGETVVTPSSPSAEDPDALVLGDWPGRAAGLTGREAEVVALITQGFSNAEIALTSSLSINSVKSYIRASYRKMGVTSRTHAVLWGLEHGLAPDRVRVRNPSPG